MTDDRHEGESIFHEVKTAEQGKKLMLELINMAEEARRIVDVMSAPNSTATKKQTMEAFAMMKVRYGQALGTLMTLMHCRILDAVAYEQLRQQLVATQQKRVVVI